MPTPPASTPTLPLVRECRPGGLRPLFAPGGHDTYFPADLQRLLFGPNDLIARFLPPAKWEMPDRSARTHGSAFPRVTYTIPDEILKTATPLTTLPRAEIDALADAIAVFSAKARPDAKGVPPYTRQCHAEFRLPNPDLDPEAYWVYGPEFDRRLLILWGVEPQNGMSLPLDKAMEKLRQREMSWRDKQELAFKLALRPDEPLSKFLAPRSHDGGLVIAGNPVPPKKLKRLKQITPKVWRDYDAAAKAFYKKAHPDTPGISPFEKELRAEFRLAGLRQAGGDYYAQRSGFVIAIDAWPRESTLPLTEDPVLKLPETAGVTATAAIPGGATVAAQLTPITKSPVGRYITYAAAAVVVIAGIITAIAVVPDPKPGEYVKDSITWDKKRPRPTAVELDFSQPIDPAVLSRAEDPPFKFVDHKILLVGDPRLSNGGKRVTLTLAKPLEDGEKYAIAISNLRDLKKRPFNPPTFSVDIEYFDRVPPVVERVNAGTEKNEILIFFSEPIRGDELSPTKFTINAVSSNKQDDELRADEVKLDIVSFPSGNVVLLKARNEFGGGKPYKLKVRSIHDLGKWDNRGNEIVEAPFDFTYEDKLPPRLGRPEAKTSFTIDLPFSKPVERTLALQPSNYRITDPNGKEIKLVAGGIELDAKGKTVTLQIENTDLVSGKYKVHVTEIVDKDKKLPPNKDLMDTFEFKDAGAVGSPLIASVETKKDSPKVTIIFERDADPRTAGDKSRYRILNSQRFPAAIVTNVQSVDGKTYVLTLASISQGRDLTAGEYLIETTGITDPFGHKSVAPEYSKKPLVYKAPSMPRQQIINWLGDRPATYKAGVVTLTIDSQIKKESAENVDAYYFDPQLIKKVKSVTTAPDKTTIELQVTGWPSSGTVRLEVDGLIVVEGEGHGPQLLRAIPVTPVQ